ncbi:MAG TPA: hypothetical protein PLZ93_11670 [Nocardioides sp.]|uniref:ABC transporter permease subunit n=1 Tax=uncultured Nocardioides sp. TaxID=198441 RepID=UPI000EBED738|nr:ABC transporter permease subunit [uncultured Nocardioides sp.]HCB06744.1 hypothetical protein [Nocardioides sp.]HRD61100.1 hypothetical protein [Nocardioides sp.]HRI96267.1 hypothetical protein [Nocardioides sp.]HRK45761.1 hypothetical protein [Nocardioides sp.]
MRAELRNLRAPGVLLTVLAGIALLFALIGLGQHHDATQWEIYTDGSSQLRSPEVRATYCANLAPAECDAAIAQEIRWNDDFGRELVRDHAYGAATQRPIGALGVVMGWLSSLLGVVLAAALAAVLIGGEWASGTARVRLARTPRRLDFVAVKFASVLIALVALAGVLWLSLAAAGPVLRQLYDVPPTAEGWSAGHYAEVQAGRGLVVLTAYAGLATGVALLVRSSLASFAVTCMVGLAAIGSSAAKGALDYSPGFWVASWMRYATNGAWRDHVWPDTFPMGNAGDPVPLDPALGLLGLLGALLVGALITVAVFARRDVRS